MTTVLILPESHNRTKFRAVAGEKESFGSTMGEALDALAKQLDVDGEKAVVLLQDFRPDEFFTEVQQRRLSYLMGKWRSARDEGTDLLSNEQEELEKLIETELAASGNRAKSLAEQMER